MSTEINDVTELAHEGSNEQLTTTPVVGTPRRVYANVLEPVAEPVAADEVHVTILGSGDPVLVRKASIDPFAWPVIGQSQEAGPPMSAPHDPPAWWADALITD